MRLPIILIATLPACTTLSPSMQVAEAVNRQVNQSITYVSDIEQYGQSDRWVVEPVSGQGDCEDYALTKAHRLNAGGIVTTASICLRNTRIPHAVALVHDGADQWVLDNLYPYAIRKQDYSCDAWIDNALLRKSIYTGK